MTTIHLAGDSTVAPGPLDGSGVAGWGAALHLYVDDEVHNEAIGGATTASFRAEGRWQRVLDAIAPGDPVVIQFGRNDQKDPENLAADGGYHQNLATFVGEVRERGGEPVLVSSVERRLFTDGGALRASHGRYPRIVRDMSRQMELALVDLTAFTRWLYLWLGREESWRLFGHAHPETGEPDNTHFGAEGARVVASYVAERLRAIRGVDDDAEPLGAWFVRP